MSQESTTGSPSHRGTCFRSRPPPSRTPERSTRPGWIWTPPRLFSAPSRRGLPASLQTHCCCRCCSCCGCWVEVENDVQGVAFCLPLLPFLPFSPWDLSRVAHFLRGPGGCSPHSSTVSCRLQMWSVVNSDPPCVVPPCHVSVRHVATLRAVNSLLLLVLLGLSLRPHAPPGPSASLPLALFALREHSLLFLAPPELRSLSRSSRALAPLASLSRSS